MQMPALESAPYLKPCPFCGCELESKWNRANPSAKCATPDCMGSKLPSLCLDVPEHIEAWNTRAQLTEDRTHADMTEKVQQHERALALLCGLHPCITVDGPPVVVAERIFDHVTAAQRAQQSRITSLDRALEYFRGTRSR